MTRFISLGILAVVIMVLAGALYSFAQHARTQMLPPECTASQPDGLCAK